MHLLKETNACTEPEGLRLDALHFGGSLNDQRLDSHVGLW